jgi:hypothetical protein
VIGGPQPYKDFSRHYRFLPYLPLPVGWHTLKSPLKL